jgi:hypothetical protein
MALVRTDVSEEPITSIIRVTRIGELVTLMMEELRSSETSVLIRPTRRHIPEDCILQNNAKSIRTLDQLWKCYGNCGTSVPCFRPYDYVEACYLLVRGGRGEFAFSASYGLCLPCKTIMNALMEIFLSVLYRTHIYCLV